MGTSIEGLQKPVDGRPGGVLPDEPPDEPPAEPPDAPPAEPPDAPPAEMPDGAWGSMTGGTLGWLQQFAERLEGPTGPASSCMFERDDRIFLLAVVVGDGCTGGVLVVWAEARYVSRLSWMQNAKVHSTTTRRMVRGCRRNLLTECKWRITQ